MLASYMTPHDSYWSDYITFASGTGSMSTILCAKSFRYDESRGGQMTSKGDGLLQSNLPLGDSLLRGASYFVTEQHPCFLVTLSRGRWRSIWKAWNACGDPLLRNLDRPFFFGGTTPTTLHLGAAASEEEVGVRDTIRTTKQEEKDTSSGRTMLPESNNNSIFCNGLCSNVFSDSPCNTRDMTMQIFYPSTIVNHLKCLGIEPTATELARQSLPSAGRMKHFLPNWEKLTHAGSLGIRGSGGIQGTVQEKAFPTVASKTPKTFQSKGGPLAGGNSKYDDKKCHTGDLTQRAWLPIHSLSCAQERWSQLST